MLNGRGGAAVFYIKAAALALISGGLLAGAGATTARAAETKVELEEQQTQANCAKAAALRYNKGRDRKHREATI